ncbi:DUF4406 domain-containing protein [Bordetella hinzii]|uniref:DUF4406 domain-containing protein n=1 Tax=Bordetella hinzii TaxID=103855 RepID=UPI0009BD5CC6|nr:DUF4406 domain-containing protein [Bordetella hinzii]VEH23197.1 DNA segregation ATPase FtsK/SpoIIIE and related proteins [Bordetella hinzii]
MRKIYISGPMTGLPKLNFPAFNAEAMRLRELGYDVINPAEINPDPSAPWQDCLRADLRAMLDCDTLALLPGWAKSQGAHLEVHVAHRVGIDIVEAAAITAGPADDDEQLIARAREVIVAQGRVSTSLLQARLRIGFLHAEALLGALERRGIISPADKHLRRTVPASAGE